MVRKPTNAGKSETRKARNERIPPSFALRASHFALLIAGVIAVGLGGSWLMSHQQTAQIADGGIRDNAGTTLAACSGSVLVFPRERRNSLELWRENYHKNTAAIVNAVSSQSQTVQCTIAPSQNVPPVMLAIASQLPPWRDTQRLVTLRTEDVGSVLLEYLRVYECALQERLAELPVRAGLEVLERERDLNPVMRESITSVPIIDESDEESRQASIIRQEMRLSRPTLHRSLLFLASTMRLGSLGNEMECLTRASADLRNTLGLTAETTACIPRIWDARGALRNSTMDNEAKE